MLNGYFDINMDSAIEPFITAGVGYAKVEFNDVSVAGISVGDSDDSVFAWQIGAGLGYALNNMASLDVTYRYFATSDPNFDGTDAEIGSHNVSLGIRYNF